MAKPSSLNIPSIPTCTELGATVYWNGGQLRPAPRKSNPNRKEMRYPTECPECGNIRMLRYNDAKDAGICAMCQRRAAGKTGYQVVLDRYGRKGLIERQAETLLKTASLPERRVAEFLVNEQINHARQYIFWHEDRAFILDFVLFDQNNSTQIVGAIEVDGAYWHEFEANQQRDQQLNQVWPKALLRLDADTYDPKKRSKFDPQNIEDQIRTFYESACSSN